MVVVPVVVVVPVDVFIILMVVVLVLEAVVVEVVYVVVMIVRQDQQPWSLTRCSCVRATRVQARVIPAGILSELGCRVCNGAGCDGAMG